MRWNGAVPAAALLVLLLVALLHGSGGYRVLNLAPQGLGLSEVAFTQTTAWGDEASAAFAFVLPEATAASLAEGGLDRLASAYSRYVSGPWRPTPAAGADALHLHFACSTRDRPGCRWHGEDPIDPAFLAAMDAALNTPGSFYASWGERPGPGAGIIVISPSQRRVFLVYGS